MAIRTQESISGFVASDPQLSQTSSGDARLYFRFGQEHFRREEDGSFTRLENTFHHLIMFGPSAEHAHARLAKGDSFVAEGYTRTVNYERDGQAVESEEFLAKKLGHDLARTRYDVERAPRPEATQRDATAREATGFDDPGYPRPGSVPPAIGM